jgi:hypothetical protein
MKGVQFADKKPSRGVTGKEPLIFKNELGKEVKIQFSEKKTPGMKGSKNIPVEYQAVHIKLSSVDHNADLILTKKELDKMRSHAAKFLKEVGKKSDYREI